MRHRYVELTDAADARINGQQFMHTGDGQSIAPARMAALRRVHDNDLHNDPEHLTQLEYQRCGFCSRRSGA